MLRVRVEIPETKGREKAGVVVDTSGGSSRGARIKFTAALTVSAAFLRGSGGQTSAGFTESLISAAAFKIVTWVDKAEIAQAAAEARVTEL